MWSSKTSSFGLSKSKRIGHLAPALAGPLTPAVHEILDRFIEFDASDTYFRLDFQWQRSFSRLPCPGGKREAEVPFLAHPPRTPWCRCPRILWCGAIGSWCRLTAVFAVCRLHCGITLLSRYRSTAVARSYWFSSTILRIRNRVCWNNDDSI